MTIGESETRAAPVLSGASAAARLPSARELYARLHAAYGQPRWWSADPYVVMVQAILVQNTAWASVEKVTVALAERLTPGDVLRLGADGLAEAIRPCGFCRGKAAAILRLTQWYGRYAYDVGNTKNADQDELRNELLAVKGIGAETADVLLVYALCRPSFVIDAYTRRFLERLGFGFANDGERRAFFETGLERDYRLYGWYHWLILEHGIRHCRKTPVCGGCPLADACAGAEC